MVTVSLVRHGLVENPRQVYYGRLAGFGLAAAGQAQAASAGRYLAAQPIAAVYHSPMQRAAETAAILAAQLPTLAPLIECAWLNEIHSPHDGLPMAELERRNWDLYGDLAAPYELPEAILTRVLAFFDHARANHAGQHVVGVSHGDPIAFAVLWANGYPSTAKSQHALRNCGLPIGYPVHASISTFMLGDSVADGALGYSYHEPG
jgi:broad specificity phosphatase PhoE